MELAVYILTQALYIVTLVVFALLSTSDVLYTVACVSLGKSPPFKEVRLVVSKDWIESSLLSNVWKRLMVTFVCFMAILFLYNFVVVLLAFPISIDNMGTFLAIGIAISLLCSLGHSYMSVIWQLAKTVSALELETNGVQALMETKLLKKGKMGFSVGILLLSLSVGGALLMYNGFVVDHSNGGMVIGFVVISLLQLISLMLVGFVVNAMFRLEFKSDDDAQIDKTALADHLEVHHCEGNVVLKPKEDIQLMEHV